MENNRKFNTLKRKSDFDRLRLEGRKTNPTKWMMVSSRSNGSKGLRCGWSIPAKIGGSILRNRYKRWCREYFRSALISANDPNFDINVIIRIRNDVKFKDISHKEFKLALEKAWTAIQRPSKGDRLVFDGKL